MGYREDMLQMVKDMDEMEAKKILASIFLKLERVNNYDYSKDKCYEDIREIYREQIVGNMMFGKNSE
jgi:hypothetical protein